jgi:hypothetical protein
MRSPVRELDEFDDDLWIRKQRPSTPRAKMHEAVSASLAENPNVVNDMVRSMAGFEDAGRSTNSPYLAGALLRMRRKRLERAALKTAPPGYSAKAVGQSAEKGGRQAKLSKSNAVALSIPWHGSDDIETESFIDQDISSSSDEIEEVKVSSLDLRSTQIKPVDILVLPRSQRAEKPHNRHSEHAASLRLANHSRVENVREIHHIDGFLERLPSDNRFTWRNGPANQPFGCRAPRLLPYIPGKIPAEWGGQSQQSLVSVPSKQRSAVSTSRTEGETDGDPKGSSSQVSIPLTSALSKALVVDPAARTAFDMYSSSSSMSNVDFVSAVRDSFQGVSSTCRTGIRTLQRRLTAPSASEPSIAEDEYLVFLANKTNRATKSRHRRFTWWPLFRNFKV